MTESGLYARKSISKIAFVQNNTFITDENGSILKNKLVAEALEGPELAAGSELEKDAAGNFNQNFCTELGSQKN